jgi:hypothetical protein
VKLAVRHKDAEWGGLVASLNSKFPKLKYIEPYFRGMCQLTAPKIYAIIFGTLDKITRIDSKYTE